MSRANYSDDLDNWAMIKWRGAVTSATRGKRGQQLLMELAEAMDAMPVKELITNELEADGSYCALGVVGAKRGMDLKAIDPEDSEKVAKEFNVAEALAREIVYINDECPVNHKLVDGKWIYARETPAERWTRVRAWVAAQLDI